MLVSDFVREIIVQNIGLVDFTPSTSLLRLVASLESVLDESRVKKMIEICEVHLNQTGIEDTDALNLAMELSLLGFTHKSVSQTMTFIQNMNLDSGAVNPLLISRIAIFAKITDDDILIDLVKRHVQKKQKQSGRLNSFYRLAALAMSSENDKKRANHANDVLKLVLDTSSLDDEFLYLYSIGVRHEVFELPVDRKLMDIAMEYIDGAFAECVSDAFQKEQSLCTDRRIPNLLLAAQILDRRTRDICLSWVKDSDVNNRNWLSSLCSEKPDLLLSISEHLHHSSDLLQIVNSDESLMLAYWIGAALILLEVGVTRRIKSIDSSLYQTLRSRRAGFDDKLKEFEKKTKKSVKGLLTRNFYRIRNSVVHGETGLTIWDLDNVTNLVSRYLEEIL